MKKSGVILISILVTMGVLVGCNKPKENVEKTAQVTNNETVEETENENESEMIDKEVEETERATDNKKIEEIARKEAEKICSEQGYTLKPDTFEEVLNGDSGVFEMIKKACIEGGYPKENFDSMTGERILVEYDLEEKSKNGNGLRLGLIIDNEKVIGAYLDNSEYKPITFKEDSNEVEESEKINEKNVEKAIKDYYVSINQELVKMERIKDFDRTQEYEGYTSDEVVVFQTLIEKDVSENDSVNRYITVGSKDNWEHCEILNEGY